MTKEIDLRFGNLTISSYEVRFTGKQNGNVMIDGERVEVPAIEECSFRVTPDRLIGVLTEMLLNLTEDQNQQEKPDEAVQEKETQIEKTQQSENDNDNNKNKRFRIVFRGQNGTSLLLAPLRNRKLIRFSAAKVEEKKIVQASTGLLSPARILTIMTAAGKVLCAKEQYVTPIQGLASLLYNKGIVSFMGKGGEVTMLDEWQKEELMFALTVRFVAGKSHPVSFRAGRVRIMENEKEFIFGFGRNETNISASDLGIIWAVCNK